MEIGVAVFATHDGAGPATLALLAEEHGFESIFFPEHSHVPSDRKTPYPGGTELPRKYAHTYDLFVALTAAAVATSRIRIGSAVCLVTQRDPIHTAKQVASIDRLCGGRFEFGIGAGWNREEMANHGTDPRLRMGIMRERVESMVAIWTTDEASYQGEHVRFERIWSWPKPAQRPHPPILVGGLGPTVLDRVLAYGDAWIPHHSGGRIIERARELQARAERPVDLMVIGDLTDPWTLEAYEKAGFRRVVHWLPSGGKAVVEAALANFERSLAQWQGS